MEEVLGFVGFSLGASLSVSVTRSLGEGVRPMVRNVLKAGIRAWDAAAGASAAVREELAAAGDEAAREAGTKPRKIVIARS
jgi:hypothetical protein